MKAMIVLVAAAALSCASTELPQDVRSASDPKADAAPLAGGVGALSASFDPETVAPGEKGNAAAAEYTCPHHPEVVHEKPGTCPKCGMDLVPKKPSRKDEHEGHGEHGGH
jgi:hypothetical protein